MCERKLVLKGRWSMCERFLIAMLLLTVGCGSSGERRDANREASSSVTLTLWSATNATEVAFARAVASEWNASQGNVKIVVQPVPTGQSSEEIILAAVASRTTPDIYANASPGEMQNLIDARGVVRLNDFADFAAVAQERTTDKILRQYQAADGGFYQIAWKANPVMMLYNTGLLRAAGVDELPETYSQFFAAAEKLKQFSHAPRIGQGDARRWMLGIDWLPIWYKRLFDFYPLYLAASADEAKLIDGQRAVFDNAASIAAFDFLRECFQRGYAPRQSFQGDAFIKGIIAARFTGPYSISYLREYAAADMQYDFGFVPRPDGLAKRLPQTYADPKSIVIFTTCKHPSEAWEFVKFMTDKRRDARLLAMTNQLPIRKDLLSDAAFRDYFEREPMMRKFAAQLETARSIETFSEMQETFDIIAGEFEASVLYDTKSTGAAVRDAARRTQNVLAAR